MIIDFRARPPVESAIASGLFSDTEDMVSKAEARGMEHARSLWTHDVSDVLAEMDAAGISQAVVPARVGNGIIGDVTVADVQGLIRSHPLRFVGFASLGPHELENADALIREWAASEEFYGISIEPGTWPTATHLDDPSLYPLYELCERLAFPVMFTGGTAGPDPTYTSPIPVDHVASDFPRLPLFAAHGMWPWVHLALHVAYRRENVYLSPDCYIFGMAGWRDYIDAASGFLQDRMFFGSSYPVLPFGDSVKQFRQLVPASLHRKLMHDNAARALGLPLQ